MKLKNKKLVEEVYKKLLENNPLRTTEEDEEVIDQMASNYKKSFENRLRSTVREVLKTRNEKKAIELSKQGVDVELETEDE